MPPRLAAGERARASGRDGGEIATATATGAATRVAPAAVIRGPGEVEVRDVEVPEPAPDQVRIRLEGSGVCGSEVPVWEGRDWFAYPLAPGAPGHEGWGRIDTVGGDVRGIEPGTRVAAISHNAHSQFDLAHADAVVELPEELDERPFPGEALGCVMNILSRSDIRAGDDVAIVGIGFLGALLTQLASRRGGRVIAISRRADALEVARSMGAQEVLSSESPDEVVAAVEELTAGDLCPRVIEATGKQAPLDLAARLTAVRGRLVVAGYHQDGSRTVDMQLWNWRGLDVVNAHERDPAVYARGIRQAVDAVVAGELDPTPLYTHEFPLERLGDALTAAARRPAGFMKALVLT